MLATGLVCVFLNLSTLDWLLLRKNLHRRSGAYALGDLEDGSRPLLFRARNFAYGTDASSLLSECP